MSVQKRRDPHQILLLILASLLVVGSCSKKIGPGDVAWNQQMKAHRMTWTWAATPCTTGCGKR